MLSQQSSTYCIKLRKNIIQKCCKLTEFSFQTNIKRINKTTSSRLNVNVNQNRANRQKFGFDPYAILPLKGSNEFQNIRQQIFRCNDGKSIRKLLKAQQNECAIKYDQSVYTAAMTKCGELGDVENTCKIMKFMHKNKIKRDRNSYNILFRALAQNEQVYEYQKYINYMVIKDKLKPDIITASILIGGCKKRGDIVTAENVWNDIIIKFKLKPTEITYVQMLSVYAKAADANKAQNKFKEMMETGIKPSETSCGALMKCFANCLDIDNVIKVKSFMELKGFKLDSYVYTSLIAVYLKNRMPIKALEMYNEYKKHLNDDIPHKSMMHARNSAFLVMLQENVKKCIDDKNTEHYYLMITKTIMEEIKQFYGRNTSLIHELAHNVLTAIVLYHYNLKNDEEKTIELFLNLCQESDIGYWSQNCKTDKWMLDFHSFHYDSAKFVLQYVFKYEKDNLLDMDDILILCGRGYHRNKYAGNYEQLNERGLMYFIQHELAKWSPTPIRSQRCQDNYALLRLFKEDVLAYFEAKQYDENKIFGDKNRKKMSSKYLNELKMNLTNGVEIEIYDGSNWEKLIIKTHVDNADFIVFDKDNKELTVNFKSLEYRIVKSVSL